MRSRRRSPITSRSTVRARRRRSRRRPRLPALSRLPDTTRAVSLTEPAASHVARFLTKRGKGVGLRLGVRTTGCSGLAYKLEYVDDLEPEDQVFESNGVKVIVDPKSLAYI